MPADIRLLETAGLECGESVLTGESLSVDKDTATVAEGTGLGDLTGAALMGTVVQAGTGRGVVVSTGPRTEFGKIATGLSTHHLDTEFQVGLRRFSMLLVYVAGSLTTSIFIINVALHRPIIDALLFSLAIAVGITPQLLPAVVSTSLAAGSRRMSRRKVLVKRLVCIEDLGDVDVLFTDKTGTLTDGHISFMRAVPVGLRRTNAVVHWAQLSCDVTVEHERAIGGNELDQALWNSPAAAGQRAGLTGYGTVARLPFDHERRMTTSLVRDGRGVRTLVTKGAPESVLERCADVPADARAALEAEFAAGNRVVALATRPAPDASTVTTADEHGLSLVGFLVFLDAPKRDAARALARLAGLGITVKVVTGDNPAVAIKVCHDLGLTEGGALTGADLDKLDDEQLAAAIATTTVFARVSPEQKARIVRVQRRSGGDVAFLGDGVNDALALHAADVGISVDSASDVAKDAAGRHPAREGSRRARRRRRRGQAHLREHDQVRADGDVQQFREHVQCGWRVAVLELPADAAVADPAEQPALRRQPARDTHRHSGRGATASAVALGHRIHPTVHALLRADQLSVRLRHLRRHDLAVPLGSDPVPHRLVRRVPGHSSVGDLRDPNAPHPILSQPCQRAPDSRGARGGGNRRPAPGYAAGRHTRLPRAAGRLLRRPRGMVVGYLGLIELGKRLFYGGPSTVPVARAPRGPSRHLLRRAARFSTARKPVSDS